MQINMVGKWHGRLSFGSERNQLIKMSWHTQYINFLLETSNTVDKFISTSSGKTPFESQLQILCKMVENYGQALQKYEKEAKSNPRLKDSDAGPPHEGWVWYSDWDSSFVGDKMWNAFWRTPDPVNPLLWFEQEGLHGTPTRAPNNEEKLMCEYVLLAVIHDEYIQQTDLTGRLIFWDRNYKGTWFQRNKFSQALWNIYYYVKNELVANEKRAKVERALQHVYADLTKDPTETGHRQSKIGFLQELLPEELTETEPNIKSPKNREGKE